MTYPRTKLTVSRLAPALLAAAAIILATAAPASAAPSDGYASFTVIPAAPFSGTLTLPAGFPATTLASDSPALTTAVNQWLPADTPPGLLVGSSRNKPYLSIRPVANTAGSVSTTTFTFATPTPVGVWGATVGDIDAEVIGITATDAAGSPVAAADLGVTTFNYCLTSASANPCGGSPGLTPLPTLASTATSVSAADPLCPADNAHCNTSGASIWITPTVALRTLSVTSTFVSGLPQAQVWFASVARTVAGVITLGTLPPVVVELINPDGDVVTSTTTGADGSFVLPPVVPSADYRLRVDPLVAPDAPIIPIDVSTADATAIALDASPAVIVAPAAQVVPTLPDTGADAGQIIAIAASFLGLGALGLAVGPIIRRRRRGREG